MNASRKNTADAPFPLTQRSAPRCALAIEVSLTSESQFFVGLTGNLSTGGVFVATYEAWPIGSRLDLEFSLPTGTVRARGTVRWLRVASDGVTPGLGIAFEQMANEERERIESFCEERAPLYYDVDDDAS